MVGCEYTPALIFMPANEAAARDKVDQIARTWIGTPYHDHGEVKGAGVDCATLLKCVYVEAGLIDDFQIGGYSPQFFLHHAEERYLGWVARFAAEIPLERVRHGDVVLYRIGKCFAHGAIVVLPGWPAIIHAHHATRCVRRGRGTAVHLGTAILDVKFFSLWPKTGDGHE
jgi:cell wall-associated NlpC family hydrolase